MYAEYYGYQNCVSSCLILIIRLMLTPYKILPIHSSYSTNGKLLTLTEKFKRTHSSLSKTSELPLANSRKEQPRIYKPRTSEHTERAHRLHVDTPARHLIEFPAFITQGLTEKSRGGDKSGSRSNKKRGYLSRKVLQKQLLESYLDNIFKRVSLIRAN